MNIDKELLEALNTIKPVDGCVNNEPVNQARQVIPKMLLEEDLKDLQTNKQAQTVVDTVKSVPATQKFNLEAIFTKEFLSTITVDDLEKSLKEVILARSTNPNKWEQDLAGYSYCFKFNNQQALSVFLSNAFIACENITKTNQELEVKVVVKEEASCKELDKLYSKVNNFYSIVPDHILDSSNYEPIHIDFEGALIQALEDPQHKEYLLKIPVAIVGEWKHPTYKVVKYSSQDLDTIKANFDNNELGFEPALYFGHSLGKDGVPAQGYLKSMEREGDILYGYWSVNKEAYRLVEDGYYRYSSSEVIMNLPSKKDNRNLGRVIYGMALTNIPFVPNQPKVLALEDANMKNNDVIFLSFEQKENLAKKKDKKKTMEIKEYSEVELALKEQVESYATKVKELELTRQELEQATKLNELKAQIEQYSHLQTEYEDTKQKLSTVVDQNKQLADQIEQYALEVRNKEVEAKLNKLTALSLPKDFVEVYSNLIKEGKFDSEVENIVVSSLSSLAQAYSTEIVGQAGSTQQTENLNSGVYEDPYQKEIERCKNLIQQRSISK